MTTPPDLLDRTIARIVPAAEVAEIRQGMRDSWKQFRKTPLTEARRLARGFVEELIK